MENPQANEVKATQKSSGVIRTGQILLILAWVLFIIPVPGLGFLGLAINTVALILSIVILAKGETRAGLVQLLCNLIVSPIIYFVSLAVFWGSITATGREARDQIKTEREKIERESAQAKKEMDEQLSRMIEQITISDAKFYFQKGSYRREPVVDFKIKNNSDSAFSDVSFRGVLSSPGRTIPWADSNFRYEIKGGLEPGEEKRLQLSPNRYSDTGWDNDDLAKRKDLVLTVTITRVQ